MSYWRDVVNYILSPLRRDAFVEDDFLDRTQGSSLRMMLLKAYPPVETTAGMIHRPNLPRGYLTRIALEVGCSRAYASKVAKRLGYHVEGQA